MLLQGQREVEGIRQLRMGRPIGIAKVAVMTHTWIHQEGKNGKANGS